MPDRLLPGTLNVGHTLPTIAQAFIYVGIIEVDVLTLVLLIAASVLGALLGAEFVSRWSERKVQLGMGIALLAAAMLMLARAVAGSSGCCRPAATTARSHGGSALASASPATSCSAR